jgi:hypothetical protein
MMKDPMTLQPSCFTHFLSVMTVLESVTETIWKMSWVEGQMEFKKGEEEHGDKRSVCKKEWVIGGPEKDPPRTMTLVLKIMQMYDT